MQGVGAPIQGAIIVYSFPRVLALLAPTVTEWRRLQRLKHVCVNSYICTFFFSRKGAKYCSCFSERIFVGNIIFPYICEVFEMMSFNLGVPDLNARSF